MLGIILKSKRPSSSSHLDLVNVDNKINSGTMVLRTHGTSYVLLELVSNLLLNTYIIPADIIQYLILATYVVLADIKHNIPLATCVVLADTNHNILFTVGCVKYIDLSVHVMAHYCSDSI